MPHTQGEPKGKLLVFMGNHWKTRGKWWLNGILWEIPSGKHLQFANWKDPAFSNGKTRIISTGPCSIANCNKLPGWVTNDTIENGPFIADLPITNADVP